MAPSCEIHASCVGLDEQAGILLRGPSGSGKSDLVLRLMDKGFHLVADDRVILDRDNGHLWASPSPDLAGYLEVRGLGLLTFPWKAPVKLVLGLELGASRPRVLDLPFCHELYAKMGHKLPFFQLRYPFT